VLAAIGFGQNPKAISTVVFQESIVESEAVAGEVAVDIEGDVVVAGVHFPHAAVVVQNEVHIEADAAGETDQRLRPVVALAARKVVGGTDQGGNTRCRLGRDLHMRRAPIGSSASIVRFVARA